jgi:hypothetical protein
LYEPSEVCRSISDGIVTTKTDCSQRYQIAIAKDVDWIKFSNPAVGLTVKRSAELLPEGQEYIDIADTDPSSEPGDKGIRFSVYSDTDGFMEIEAAGGCTKKLEAGVELSVAVTTEYTQTK